LHTQTCDKYAGTIVALAVTCCNKSIFLLITTNQINKVKLI